MFNRISEASLSEQWRRRQGLGAPGVQTPSPPLSAREHKLYSTSLDKERRIREVVHALREKPTCRLHSSACISARASAHSTATLVGSQFADAAVYTDGVHLRRHTIRSTASGDFRRRRRGLLSASIMWSLQSANLAVSRRRWPTSESAQSLTRKPVGSSIYSGI